MLVKGTSKFPGVMLTDRHCCRFCDRVCFLELELYRGRFFGSSRNFHRFCYKQIITQILGQISHILVVSDQFCQSLCLFLNVHEGNRIVEILSYSLLSGELYGDAWLHRHILNSFNNCKDVFSCQLLTFSSFGSVMLRLQEGHLLDMYRAFFFCGK